jgi:hypothetical protein
VNGVLYIESVKYRQITVLQSEYILMKAIDNPNAKHIGLKCDGLKCAYLTLHILLWIPVLARFTDDFQVCDRLLGCFLYELLTTNRPSSNINASIDR